MMRDPARLRADVRLVLLASIVFGVDQAGGLARSAEEPAAQGEHGAEPEPVMVWPLSLLSKVAVAADGVDEGNIHSDWTFSPSGNLAALVGVDGIIHLWDLEHGTTAAFGTVNNRWRGACLAFSEDEERILIGDLGGDVNNRGAGNIRLLSITAGGEIRRFALPTDESGYYFSQQLAFVGGGRHVLAHVICQWGSWHGGGGYGLVFLFDAETGEQLHAFRGALGDVSEDGRFALTYDRNSYAINSAVVSHENALQLVDLETYETLRRFEHPSVDGARFDEDERVVVSQSDDGVVIRWDRETGEQLPRPDEKP